VCQREEKVEKTKKIKSLLKQIQLFFLFFFVNKSSTSFDAAQSVRTQPRHAVGPRMVRKKKQARRRSQR
jgi:hypothetical protein